MKNILFNSSVLMVLLSGLFSPALAQTCKVQKPLVFDRQITSPGGTIAVVTDRSENIVEFFQRNHILVGQMKKIQPLDITKPTSLFLQQPSNNFQGQNQSNYSAQFNIAPASAVFRSAKFPVSSNILFIQDTMDERLFHPVGYMTHSSQKFFASNAAIAGEKLTTQNFIYRPGK
jgi:hypothetical protein